MSVPDAQEYLDGRSPDREAVEEDVKRTMLTGAAITIPLVITLLVVAFVVNFVSGLMDPIVGVLRGIGVTGREQAVVVKFIALLALVAVTFAIGFVAERWPGDGTLGTSFDAAMERIPGVGSVYTSVNRMSDVLLDSDTRSFQEVKLVEFPHRETYAIGFLTSEAAGPVEDAAGHAEMQTVFVPLAPNPFMGGHLVAVPTHRVHDVDMTVEEGVQAIVTSGVAAGESANRAR